MLADAADRREARRRSALLIAKDERGTVAFPRGFIRMDVAVNAPAGLETDRRGGAGTIEFPDGVVEVAIELAQDVGDGGIGQELSFEAGAVAGNFDSGDE